MIGPIEGCERGSRTSAPAGGCSWRRRPVRGSFRRRRGAFRFGASDSDIRHAFAPHVNTAVDCGRYVNPQGSRKQIEGAAIDRNTVVQFGKNTISTSAVVQSSFRARPITRMNAGRRMCAVRQEGRRRRTRAAAPSRVLPGGRWRVGMRRASWPATDGRHAEHASGWRIHGFRGLRPRCSSAGGCIEEPRPGSAPSRTAPISRSSRPLPCAAYRPDARATRRRYSRVAPAPAEMAPPDRPDDAMAANRLRNPGESRRLDVAAIPDQEHGEVDVRDGHLLAEQEGVPRHALRSRRAPRPCGGSRRSSARRTRGIVGEAERVAPAQHGLVEVDVGERRPAQERRVRRRTGRRGEALVREAEREVHQNRRRLRHGRPVRQDQRRQLAPGIGFAKTWLRQGRPSNLRDPRSISSARASARRERRFDDEPGRRARRGLSTAVPALSTARPLRVQQSRQGQDLRMRRSLILVRVAPDGHLVEATRPGPACPSARS